MLDKVLRICALYDFYGALLTDKQQQCIEMHYLNDLSLSEIADEFMVSRQAIHDILRRSEQILNDYEDKLHLVERYQLEHHKIQEAVEMLGSLPSETRQNLPKIDITISILMDLIQHKD